MTRTLAQRAIALALAAVFSSVPILMWPHQATATVTCTTGVSRLATAGDLENMRAAGIPNPTVGMEYCPDDKHTGKTAGDAKAYLRTLPNKVKETEDNNFKDLNDSFAICASRFLKDFQSRYGRVVIESAYRSPRYDAAMCVNNPRCGALMNNPNPQGNHQRGLAMDISAAAGQQALWDFARANPKYGVCFPFTGEGGGFRDTVHMILFGGPGSESTGPGCRGVQKCSDADFTPQNIQPPTYQSVTGARYPTSVSAPTGGTNNPFANQFNPIQQNPDNPYCVVSTDPIYVVYMTCSQWAQMTTQQPVPQQPSPQPNIPQPTSPAAQTSAPVAQQTGIDSRVASAFPLPIPDRGTLTYAPPAQYIYAATQTPQTTAGSGQNANTNGNAYTPTAPSGSSGGTGTSAATGGSTNTNGASTGTSVPTQLNENIQNGTPTEITADETRAPGSDAEHNPANTNNISNIRYTSSTPAASSQPNASVSVAPVGATDTFANPKPNPPVPRPATTSLQTNQPQSLVVALLTTVRDSLSLFVQTIRSGTSVGFNGAWQAPGDGPSY
jgi:hypothetical protein